LRFDPRQIEIGLNVAMSRKDGIISAPYHPSMQAFYNLFGTCLRFESEEKVEQH